MSGRAAFTALPTTAFRERGHSQRTGGMGGTRQLQPFISLWWQQREPAEPKPPHPLSWVPVCYHCPGQLATSPAKLAWRQKELCQEENRRGSFPMWNQAWKDQGGPEPREAPARCRAPLGSSLLPLTAGADAAPSASRNAS